MSEDNVSKELSENELNEISGGYEYVVRKENLASMMSRFPSSTTMGSTTNRFFE